MMTLEEYVQFQERRGIKDNLYKLKNTIMKERYLTGKLWEVISTALSITMNNFQLIKKSVAHNSQQFIFIHYDY